MSDAPDEEEVRILVVDDREEDRLAMTSLLAAPDYHVVTAGSGNEALKRVLENDYALIMLDVMMPGMDGFETASIIKQRERSSHTPIIFLTAAGSDIGFIYRAYSAGAVDYIMKPIERDVMRAKVSTFVDLFRKDRRIQKQARALREAERRERDRQVAEVRIESAKRYQNLADAIPQIVWTAQPDGNAEYYNRRWFEYTGLTLQKAQGRGWLTVIHPDDVARCERSWRAAVASGSKYQEECRLRRVDGTYRWHICEAILELDKTGKPLGWLGTYADFDDLKRAQAESESQRRKFQFLADASAMLTTSLEYRETLANVAKRLVPELCDWCCIDVLPSGAGGVGDAGTRIIASLTSAPEPRVMELPRGTDGAGAAWLASALEPHAPTIWNELPPAMLDFLAPTEETRLMLRGVGTTSALFVPLQTRNRTVGALAFVSGQRPYRPRDIPVVRDLAHRIAMAIDNATLYQEATHAISARDEFMSIASHELRTPLTGLLLHLQSLQRICADAKRASTDPRVPEKLNTSVKQTRRLEKLIESLFDVSRITMGQLELQYEEFDGAEVVRDIGSRFKAEADLANCSLDVSAPAEASGMWDRLRLEQVITNLLSNAIKYAAGKSIAVVMTASDDRVRVEVRDKGIGIAKEHVDRIFGRFERAVSTRNYGGLGMGLYITRTIVEAHGGEVSVVSEPGVGSTFVVDLPRRCIASRTSVSASTPTDGPAVAVAAAIGEN